MAPELIRGQITVFSDVWSCGIILFIMLFGETPFKGANVKEIQEKILNGEFKFSQF